jgi:hypothetical protein
MAGIHFMGKLPGYAQSDAADGAAIAFCLREPVDRKSY